LIPCGACSEALRDVLIPEIPEMKNTAAPMPGDRRHHATCASLALAIVIAAICALLGRALALAGLI
jgi:hypothetical protein